MVVVTSIRRSRRKLRYESWHLLHLYGYLGVGLAIPHMLWTGADFTSSPLATVYWWTLWAVVAASVLVFRIARPVWRSWRHDVRVVAVERDGAPRRDGADARTRHARPRRAAGSVLRVAIPRRRGLDARPPVLAGGARRTATTS